MVIKSRQILTRVNVQKRLIPLGLLLIVIGGLIFIAITRAANKAPTRPGNVTLPTSQADFVNVSGQPINATWQRFNVSSKYGFVIELPRAWTISKYSASPKNTETVYLRATAPNTSFDTASHSDLPKVTQGALIEVIMTAPTQYKTLDDYMGELDGSATDLTRFTVAGESAARYRLAPDLEAESRPQYITMLIARGAQYSFSYTAPTLDQNSPGYVDYQHLLETFHFSP